MMYSLIFIYIAGFYQKRQCGNSAGIYSFKGLIIHRNKLIDNYGEKLI